MKYGIWCTPPEKSKAKADWLRDVNGRKRGVLVEFATLEEAERGIRRGGSVGWKYEARVLPEVQL